MARLIDRLMPTPVPFETRNTSVSIVGALDPDKKLAGYDGFVRYGYAGNGPIWSLVQVRAQALSEIEFAFQDKSTLELSGPVAELESPWPGGSAGDLETAIEVDVSLSGNAYVHRQPRQRYFEMLHPGWIDAIVLVSDDGVHRTHGGYMYYPDGVRGNDPVVIPVSEVAHISPMPDPTTKFRGQSWITAVAREGDADSLMTKHKGKFFTNGATSTLAVTAQSLTEPQRKMLKEQFQAKQAGWQNAYKTVFLEGGADIKVIGAGMEQISFSQVQGKGETRLAAAANVPPIVAGFSEGLQAGTYSNYGQAVRKFVDFFCRPRWRQDCEALGPLLNVPAGHRLWYDDRRISFLQQDAKDAAEIRKEDASTLESLIRGGFTPESAKEAVTSGRYEGLTHTGLVSVQLQPPGTTAAPINDGDPEDD